MAKVGELERKVAGLELLVCAIAKEQVRDDDRLAAIERRIVALEARECSCKRKARS